LSNTAVVTIVTMLTTLGASSGFWTYVLAESGKKNANTKLLMGLAYIKACELGFQYIERGSISRDELEDFQKYLYKPYIELGGNGVLEHLMKEINTLHMTQNKDDYHRGPK